VTLALSKYAGSHAWLAEQRPDAFPLPAPDRVALVPFCGAGSVALALYAGRFQLIVSDKNPRLVNVWEQVRENVDGVLGTLGWIVNGWKAATVGAADRTAHDLASREVFEGVRNTLDEGSPQTRAAKMLFVLRASFNGLWRVNLDGQCNSPHGKPGPDVDLLRADDTRRIAELLLGVDIRCEDFAATLADARTGDAVYLDPPFQGTHTAFCADGAEWEARQVTLPGVGGASARERLAAELHALDARGVRWTLSDADTPITRSLYRGWPFEIVVRQNSVTCKAEDRGEGASELLVRNWR
jgi:DNA adenine methylase